MVTLSITRPRMHWLEYTKPTRRGLGYDIVIDGRCVSLNPIRQSHNGRNVSSIVGAFGLAFLARAAHQSRRPCRTLHPAEANGLAGIARSSIISRKSARSRSGSRATSVRNASRLR